MLDEFQLVACDRLKTIVAFDDDANSVRFALSPESAFFLVRLDVDQTPLGILLGLLAIARADSLEDRISLIASQTLELLVHMLCDWLPRFFSTLVSRTSQFLLFHFNGTLLEHLPA